MTGYQLMVTLMGSVSLAASVWAVWCVSESGIGYKPAWIIVSVFGFVGLGVNWTNPDDLLLLIGAQVPPVMIFEVTATKSVFVKVMLPIGAVVALAMSDGGKAGRPRTP